MKRNYYSSNNNSTSSGDLGLLGVLQLIFIVLKLTNLVDWTWPQVFIPTFVSLGLLLIIIIVIFIVTWGASRDKH